MADTIVSGRCLLRKHRSPYETLHTSPRILYIRLSSR